MIAQVKANTGEITKKPEEDAFIESEDDDDFIGPPSPENFGVSDTETAEFKKKVDDDEDSDEFDDDNKHDGLFVPCSHEAQMKHGTKAITAISVDPSGARLASGYVDYDVSFWEFTGMVSNMRSFRTLQPADNHQIRDLHYSNRGDLLLVVSGANQAKVIARDGFKKLVEFMAGVWNPTTEEEFLTIRGDGTARSWAFNENGMYHKSIIKCRAQNDLKGSPKAVNHNRDGKVISCGWADGSLQLWDLRESTVSSAIQLRKAHQPEEVTSICFSHMGDHLLTRSCDEAIMKLWEKRKFKQAVHEVEDLFTRYDTTDGIFSPNNAIVTTGLSLQEGEEGVNHFYNVKF